MREDLERVAPGRILAELADRDVVAFDAAGEVRAAYPFSPTTTAIRVTWEDGPTVFAMCAIDALGMSAMLDRPVTITAAEPETGATVRVDVSGDRASWRPDGAVVFVAGVSDSYYPSVDETCGVNNFFTSAEAARAWARRHPAVDGGVLDQPTALADAVAEFGALM